MSLRSLYLVLLDITAFARFKCVVQKWGKLLVRTTFKCNFISTQTLQHRLDSGILLNVNGYVSQSSSLTVEGDFFEHDYQL